MFELIKKLFTRNTNNQAHLDSSYADSIFPKASELAGVASKTWEERTPEEILAQLMAKSESGDRSATFYNSTMSRETMNQLKYKGYNVKESTIKAAPYFEISW